jgi:PhzF family phenazine biosynthesis protein
MSLQYHHVDVFTPFPYSGNSLAVFVDAPTLAGNQMALITRELRHFESIFLWPGRDQYHQRVRVYDLLGELNFAGHPVIGAAAVLHAIHGVHHSEQWTMQLAARTVEVKTARRDEGGFTVSLNQGAAEFVNRPESHRWSEFTSWFGLGRSDLDDRFAPEVVSTGLKYLILPVRSDGLAAARISIADLEKRLATVGAEFAYLLDVANLEGRHWNNDGIVEDVATGSAAGCVAAYMRKHGVLGDGIQATLHQGRFTGRPSEMTIRAHGSGTDVTSIDVGGEVSLLGTGSLEVLPG